MARLLLIALLFMLGRKGVAAEVLRLDHAYYNPVSLVLKDKHWVEDAVGPGVQVLSGRPADVRPCRSAGGPALSAPS